MLNRSINIFFSLILLFTVSFTACKKDTTDPIIPPCTTPGDLEVRVCDMTQTNFFAAAEVFLYNTAAERDADASRTNYLNKRLTDSTNPNTSGAIFYQLEPKTYYFFARWSNKTLNFDGVGESMAPTCKTTIVFCTVS